MERPDNGSMMEEMMRTNSFEQKWHVYVLHSPEFLVLPHEVLMMLRMAFYAGGIASVQSVLEVHHNSIDAVLEQLKPKKIER